MLIAYTKYAFLLLQYKLNFIIKPSYYPVNITMPTSTSNVIFKINAFQFFIINIPQTYCYALSEKQLCNKQSFL